MIKSLWLLILPLYLSSFLVHSEHYFTCEKVFPLKLQVESLKYCTQTPGVIINHGEKKTLNLNFSLSSMIHKHQNTGASIINFPNNNTKIVYRSANLGMSPLCIKELHDQRDVETIIKLYSGLFGYSPQLSALEMRVFQNVGGKTYMQILDYEVDHLEQNQIEGLNKQIAEIISYIRYSKGNVLIHCLVGEHDTGVIFGVLQKCYNHLPLEMIEKETVCHISDSSTPYEVNTRKNIFNIIKQYPCDLLKNI